MKYYTVETTNNKFALLSDENEDESGDERISATAPVVVPEKPAVTSPAAKRGGRVGANAERSSRGGLRGGVRRTNGRQPRPVDPEIPIGQDDDVVVAKANRLVAHKREVAIQRLTPHPHPKSPFQPKVKMEGEPESEPEEEPLPPTEILLPKTSWRENVKREDIPEGAIIPVAPVRGRDHDRHWSGTGRGREMKKAGGGSHNWGSNDDTELERADVVPGALEKEEVSPAVVMTPEETPTPAEPVEPEMIDLAEYQRQREARRANLPALPQSQVREANGTESELIKEGYEKYVKAPSRKADQNSVHSHDSDDAGKRPKAINFFQLAEEQGNSVRLFPGLQGAARGGRGGRGGRGRERDGFREDSRKNVDERQERRAPREPRATKTLDLADEVAFPGLASA